MVGAALLAVLGGAVALMIARRRTV